MENVNVQPAGERREGKTSLIYVAAEGHIERPNFDDTYVLIWPGAGVLIPWPEGMTAVEAFWAWVRKQT